jgi:hypothetical protein
MARALGLALALGLLATPSAHALTEPSGALAAGGEETVLRLHDLPPGYQFGNDSPCRPLEPLPARISTNRLERRYSKWIVEQRPVVCNEEFEQVFKVPGLGPAPPQIVAAIISTPSEEASVRGFELFTALGTQFEDDDGTVPIPPSGIPARLTRSEDAVDESRTDRPGSFLYWRHGKLIATAGAAGMDPSSNDRAALHFGQIQQQRMEAPTPYIEAERDDAEVQLDDPGLKLPVYWAGSSFVPGRGLPATDLLNAFPTGRGVAPWYRFRRGPPGAKLRLLYDGFDLDAWTRQSWKRYQRSVFGRLNRRGRCARTTEVALERGRAVIYAGYGGPRPGACPQRPPDRHWAITHIGDVVIGVNLAICPLCQDWREGPYNSLRGMKTIVRALMVRPRPVY